MAATRPRVHADALAEAIGLGAEELAMRKRFLAFDDSDAHRLAEIYDLTQEHVDQVIEAFYDHLLSFPETAAFFRDPRLLEHVKGRQKEYFIRLTQGDYEQAYVADRLRLGSIHEKIGLPVRSFLGMYAFYLREIAALLLKEHVQDPDQAFATFHSLAKLLFFDIGLGVDIYIYQRERTIALQQEAIRELSTPVIACSSSRSSGSSTRRARSSSRRACSRASGTAGRRS
jgi:rsbT co-antagonist protein RsbR